MTELEQAREKIKSLKREIRIMQLAAEERNRQLAALHVVWCSGGCPGGVEGEVDEELVLAAEANTKRLRQWWENHKYREKRKLDD